MCKGTIEEKNHSSCKRFPSNEIASTCDKKSTSSSISCELCGLKASLYCHSDNAYLCRKCDNLVHKANFLALRHVRSFLCNTCQNLTRRYLLGASLEVILPTTIENLPNDDSINRNCSRKEKSTTLFQFL
ncbi:unnamed protein product [Trifolium pratense]|uniref:Uncharacterized protein n=1 Tax=Trifolium pratense TaxID=57577 RepID=A0ACB0KF50_TRIPR|nr:unnamed protein product [Trifolium pratense]